MIEFAQGFNGSLAHNQVTFGERYSASAWVRLANLCRPMCSNLRRDARRSRVVLSERLSSWPTTHPHPGECWAGNAAIRQGLKLKVLPPMTTGRAIERCARLGMTDTHTQFRGLVRYGLTSIYKHLVILEPLVARFALLNVLDSTHCFHRGFHFGIDAPHVYRVL